MLISHIFISSKLLNIHVILSLSLEQKSFDLGIINGDINRTQGSTTVSLGGSSTMVMPQVLGEYTTILECKRQEYDETHFFIDLRQVHECTNVLVSRG